MLMTDLSEVSNLKSSSSKQRDWAATLEGGGLHTGVLATMPGALVRAWAVPGWQLASVPCLRRVRLSRPEFQLPLLPCQAALGT